MSVIAWWFAAITVAVALSLILSVIAVWRSSGLRQCRNVVQAYAPRALERQCPAATADPELEDTQEFSTIVDEHPTGRHARLEPTELLPAVGVLRGGGLG